MTETHTMAEFWRGRRVLLTGHTGFKGAWMSLWLEGLGAEVTGYALPPAGESNLPMPFGPGSVCSSPCAATWPWRRLW